LHIELGGWHCDDGRVAIGVGIRIGSPVSPPIRPPIWPDANPDTHPWASPPPTSMPPASVPPASVPPTSMASVPPTSMASAPMPATVGVPWDRAAQEQRRHDDDHSHPLLLCSHRDHLPDITVFVPCETLHASRRRGGNARGIRHDWRPTSQSIDLMLPILSHGAPGIATTGPHALLKFAGSASFAIR
jgi:hypothetical protein